MPEYNLPIPMNRTIVLLIFILISLPVLSQELFHEAQFKRIIPIDSGYISIVSQVEDKALAPYLVNKTKGVVVQGIAVHDREGKIRWTRAFNDMLILDAKQKGQSIYVLHVDQFNSKTESGAALFETVLKLNGKTKKTTDLTIMRSEVCNSKIRAMYDSQGNIWEWVTWEHNPSILINGRAVVGGEQFNILLRNLNSLENSTHLMTSTNVRINERSTSGDKILFHMEGSDLKIDNNEVIGQGNFLIEFHTSGPLNRGICISNSGLSVKHLLYHHSNIYLSGSFRGNDSLPYKPAATLLTRTLQAPKHLLREETAANGFIACLTDTFSIEWLQLLKSERDILIHSMSANDSMLIIALEYKDYLSCEGVEIKTLKDSTRYEFDDAALLLFNTNGKMISNWRAGGNGYEKLRAHLAADKLIMTGNFTYDLQILGHDLHDSDIRGCNFLLFDDKKLLKISNPK